MANKVTSIQVQGSTYEVDPHLTFDGFPVEGSTNPVTSNGIAIAVQGAAVGTNISVGRTANTPVGYCSIAYGTNNTAGGDYSIVFGEDNTVYTKYTIACGVSNGSFQGSSIVVLGNGNKNSGNYNILSGYNNQIGVMVNDITSSPPNPNDPNRRIVFGYVSPDSRKIYIDAEKQHEITFSETSNFTCYFLDLTTGSGSQNPGDIYEAKYTYNSRTRVGTITSLTHIYQPYVKLQDLSRNDRYVYRGIAYYNATKRKAFEDPAESIDIYNDKDANSKGIWGDAYFDMNSHEFITLSTKYSDPIIKKTLYRGNFSSWSSFTSVQGRRAYVRNNSTDASKENHVYTSPDFLDETDITNSLYDGEYVVDINGTGVYWYSFTSSHTLVDAVSVNDGGPDSSYGRKYYSPGAFTHTNGAMALGNGGYTTGTTGSIVAGSGCKIYRASEGSAVFGVNSDIRIGPKLNDQASVLVAGIGNKIDSPTIFSHTFSLIGQTNETSRILSQADRHFMIGAINKFYDCTYDAITIGSYNEATGMGYSQVIGYTNKIYNRLSQSTVIGAFNQVKNNDGVITATMNEQGIWEGAGISYDSTNKIYTYPTDKIISFVGRSIDRDNYGDVYANHRIKWGKSTDGHTIINTDDPRNSEVYMFGYMNNNYTKTSSASQNSYIIGSYNTYYYEERKVNGWDQGAGHCLLGFKLTVNYTNTESVMGAVFLGTFNSMSGTTGAQLVVGIGSYNSEANGFMVYRSGITAAPSAPDTINGASSAASAAGIDASKVLITYGMLQDYTGGHSGGGRPTVTTLTLAAADWSNQEITETVQGITEGSIVIIQPSGNPYTFYEDCIYLDSQDTDSLTFGCSHTPSVDVTVKVVYWP